MRFRIDLQPYTRAYTLPYDYQYKLAVAIYKLFSAGNEQFGKWLHDKGMGERRYKMFTFSKLYFDRMKPGRKGLECFGGAFFYFSTINNNDYAQAMLKGVFKSKNLYLGNYQFQIAGIKPMPEVELKETQKYSMLSSSVASKLNIYDSVDYLTPERSDIESALENNLLNKYRILHGQEYTGNLKITLDKDYFFKHNSTKLHRIKNIKVKSFICPLTIQGGIEIHKLAYSAGIGEKNAMGYGIIKEAG
ncbi:MAG: CRISPR-associated endoribonuclease Cas6 [Bacteroidota bacterium]